VSVPSSREANGDHGEGAVPLGRAEARRVTSAALAEFAERQADAVAALDRALEARLGELDQAFTTRRNHLEGHLGEVESTLVGAVQGGIAEFRRAASDERRLLHEEAAAQLAALEAAVARHLGELETVVAAHQASLDELVDRLEALERPAPTSLADPDDHGSDHEPL
jgi:hypothetical protein